MKVVVANPPWPGEGYGARTNVRWPHRRGDKALQFPIYLAYAIAELKESGFKTYGEDAVCEELGISGFVEKMKKLSPDIVIMEISTPSLMYDLETAQKLKEEVGAFVAFCGPHATYSHSSIIDNYKFVDACIRGELDHAVKELCLALDEGNALNNLKGVTFRHNNKTVVNEDAQLIENLDELPFPDREEFKIENYQQAFFSGKKTGLMISSRGCPYKCNFCLWPDTVVGHVYRTRSPENVVDEIEYLIKNYSADEIYFDDATFVLNKKRVQGICREIMERGIDISWLCMGRVDTVDRETLQMMKRAGCTQVFYGFESGSEKILETIDKRITKEQVRNAVRMTQEAGLVASGSFIFGLPQEDKETVKQTLDFAKSLKADYVQFVLAAPFPGTKLYEEAKQKGLLQINSWADLDGTKGPIMRTEHLSKEDLEGIIRKAYIGYYTSPGIVWQNLKKMRSLRDVRRILRGVKSVLSRVIYYKK